MAKLFYRLRCSPRLSERQSCSKRKCYKKNETEAMKMERRTIAERKKKRLKRRNR